jgi:hypothetical protein
MRRLTAEQLAVAAVLLIATAAGVISALGVVRPPSALCITPYGTATVAPGCDPGQVSAALGAVAGALTAAVTAVFGFAVEGAVLSVCQHRAAARRSVDANTTNG